MWHVRYINSGTCYPRHHEQFWQTLFREISNKIQKVWCFFLSTREKIFFISSSFMYTFLCLFRWHSCVLVVNWNNWIFFIKFFEKHQTNWIVIFLCLFDLFRKRLIRKQWYYKDLQLGNTSVCRPMLTKDYRRHYTELLLNKDLMFPLMTIVLQYPCYFDVGRGQS